MSESALHKKTERKKGKRRKKKKLRKTSLCSQVPVPLHDHPGGGLVAEVVVKANRTQIVQERLSMGQKGRY